ncbi:MAG: tetratricopeptide repeat protein [Candidatus Heimdallarchaeaceae archaeon]
MNVKTPNPNYPPEFNIYIPFFDKAEQDCLIAIEDKIHPDSSLEKLKDPLIDILDEIKEPSSAFLYALGKVFFITSDFDLIDTLYEKYKDVGLLLWKAKVLIRRGMNLDAIRIAQTILKEEYLPKYYRLNAFSTLASAHSNLGSLNQYQYYIEQIFHEAISLQKYNQEEKLVVNDVLLLGHATSIWIERLTAPLMKLENKIDVAIHIALELQDRFHLGTFHNMRGVIYRYVGKIEEALEDNRLALDFFKRVGARRSTAAAKGNLASIYIVLNEFDTAQNYLESAFKIFTEVGDYKNQALIYSSLGDIAIAKGDYEKGLESYEESLEILESLNLRELQLYCNLAELYYHLNKIEKMKIILQIIENSSFPVEGVISSYLKFFKGLLEMKNFNYGEATKHLNEALYISDMRGKGVLSAKILIHLISLYLKQYDSFNNQEYLIKAVNKINEVLPFYKETNKVSEQIIVLIVLAKIEAILGDTSSSFNSLQKAKELLKISKRKRKKDKLYNLIVTRISELEEIFERGIAEPNFAKNGFKEEIIELEDIGIRQVPDFDEEVRTAILALLIIHPSGIPMATYTVRKSHQFRDELMFGGFIVAVKDMIEELFREPEKSKVMVISYGNNKIIMENSPNKNFSVIILSSKDSFIFRRKLHSLTEELVDLDIPKQYIGELDPEIVSKINEQVERIFGSNLVLYEGPLKR